MNYHHLARLGKLGMAISAEVTAMLQSIVPLADTIEALLNVGGFE